MKALVVFHGDCDGVISAGLYIRRFLMDYYPRNLVMRFSQPWRIVRDLDSAIKSVGIENLEEVVILDLALNDDLVSYIKNNLRDKNVTIVDHHVSSQHVINEISKQKNVKIFWRHTLSTPAVLATMIRDLNPYERELVEVANVCEGGESCNEVVKQIADRLKIALALDPTDSNTYYRTVARIIEGAEVWNDNEIEQKYRRGKWLLNMLVKNLERKSIQVHGWYIVAFTAAESLIYAGMFGIASSEFAKKHHRPIVVIRGEEGKIVITVRSPEGRALELCKAIAENLGASFYGGHREAASLTLYSTEDVELVVEKLKNVIGDALAKR